MYEAVATRFVISQFHPHCKVCGLEYDLFSDDTRFFSVLHSDRPQSDQFRQVCLGISENHGQISLYFSGVVHSRPSSCVSSDYRKSFFDH